MKIKETRVYDINDEKILDYVYECVNDDDSRTLNYLEEKYNFDIDKIYDEHECMVYYDDFEKWFNGLNLTDSEKYDMLVAIDKYTISELVSGEFNYSEKKYSLFLD